MSEAEIEELLGSEKDDEEWREGREERKESFSD